MHFGKINTAEINEGVIICAKTEGARLIDVRDEDEYLQGHIPNSKNIPIPQFDKLPQMFPLDKPLFVYCSSSERSSNAAKRIRLMGFSDITDLGSIEGYKGPLE